MDSNDETIIKLSKKKLLLLLLGSSAFVAIGILMLSLDAASIQSRRGANNPIYVYGLALVAILFFGSFGLYALKKLFDRKPALIFNRTGIVDNASSVSPGFIPWSEIVGAEICEIQNEKLLIINVRDPQEYIARGSSLKQTLNNANYNLVGSPISIASNTLAIDFPELVSLFDRYRQKYGVGAGDVDLLHPLFGQDVRSMELFGVDDNPLKPDVEPEEARLLNWSPFAVRGTVGSGGLGIFVLSVSSLDMLFHIKTPFWAAITISLLPMLIFFVAVPDFLPPKIVRPAQWFAAIWYLVFAVLSLALTAYRGFGEAVYIFLAGFILLGAWPCVLVVRKLRIGLKSGHSEA